MATVAFLGLGRMGAGMARRLLAAGHDLRVFNRTAARAAPFGAAGARCCATVREACTGAAAAIAMVSDDEASRALWLGADGALSALGASKALAIECSTLSHDWVLELSGRAARRGLRFLDAPVTGLPDAAAAGELTLLVGADPQHLAAARPLLAAIAREIVEFGPPGAGTAYKLLVNMLGAVQIASAAEAMALAEQAGLDAHRVAHTIASGQAGSPQVVRNTRRMAEDDHEQAVIFTPRLRLKDVQYALAFARKLDLGTPFGALAAQSFGELCALGADRANESAVIEVARRRLP